MHCFNIFDKHDFLQCWQMHPMGVHPGAWGYTPAPFLPPGEGQVHPGQVLCTRTQRAPTLGHMHPTFPLGHLLQSTPGATASASFLNIILLFARLNDNSIFVQILETQHLIYLILTLNMHHLSCRYYILIIKECSCPYYVHMYIKDDGLMSLYI